MLAATGMRRAHHDDRRYPGRYPGGHPEGCLRPCRKHVLTIAAALILAGCSQVPVWLDPTKSEPEQPQVLETAAGEREVSFPNLSSVPDRPPQISKPRERQALLEKLQADRASADAERTGGGAQAGQTSPDAPPLAVIYFDRGVTSVGAGNRNMLFELVERHWKRGGRLRVVGLASPLYGGAGDDAQVANFQVAVARAHNVAVALVELGVPFVQIDVSARISDGTEEASGIVPARALQRRAEIYLEF